MEIKILKPKDAAYVILDEIKCEKHIDLIKRIKSHYPYNENSDAMEVRKKKGQILVHLSRNKIFTDYHGFELVSPYLILDYLLKTDSIAILTYENFAVYMRKENSHICSHGFFYFDNNEDFISISNDLNCNLIYELTSNGSRYYVCKKSSDAVSVMKKLHFINRFGIYNLINIKNVNYKKILVTYLFILIALFSLKSVYSHRNSIVKENLERLIQENKGKHFDRKVLDHSRNNLMHLLDKLVECDEIKYINKISVDGKKFSIVISSSSGMDVMEKLKDDGFSSLSLVSLSINKDGLKELHINGGFNE